MQPLSSIFSLSRAHAELSGEVGAQEKGQERWLLRVASTVVPLRYPACVVTLKVVGGQQTT